MKEALVSEQKQIFDVPLESAEIEAIKALVGKCKANAAFTQQLALDASRLVTTSQERLAKQSDAGFIKRLISTISGTTSVNKLLNQKDMLQIQKFAWHFLQQLQQQNLINAQSIAVIRNNLGTMNEYIIETRNFLELAIDKIDNRLQHVENNTSFNNWSLNIDANKRRFKSTPKTLLILRLTYDFMRSHKNVVLIERDINNYLVTTLEKLDINCDEEVKLLDFISELIDQIEVVGIDQYRAIIELSFDEHTVDSDYIQKNISGIGFNALYFLSDYYENIVDLIGDDELCNSDEFREKIISKFFGSEFSGLSSTYSIRNLICEMIGGSQLSIDVYKDEHGLSVVQDEVFDEAQPDVVALVSSLPEIRAHTFFDSENSGESKRNYLLLLALCVENSASLNEHAREFIALLAEKSGFPELQREILELADNPRKHDEYQPVMLALLDDDNKKYTWLLDVFFLLTLAQKAIENPQIKVILGILRPTHLKESLPNMLVIISGSDASQILDAGGKLAAHTQGWKNVFRYRELRFVQYFSETVKKLMSASFGVTRVSLEMLEVYRKGMEHAVFFSFSDGGLMSNLSGKAAATLCTQGRKSAISSLNEFRKKASDSISENGFALSQANSIVSHWNFPTFEFKDVSRYSDFDLDNSATNDDWGNQFEHYYRQIDDSLQSFSQACDDAMEQIELFKNGNFDHSVVKLREQNYANRLRQQELEKLEKQSVTITKDGKEHLLSIEWQQVENFPCDLEKIRHIKTDGQIWFVVEENDSDQLFYRSEDGVNWQQVRIDISDIKIRFNGIDIVNGMWIIKNGEVSKETREEGCYYSSNAITWQHSGAPESSKNRGLSLDTGRLSYGNIIYFNGLWLWRTTQYQKYRYVEKGFFSDTTKTDSYPKTIVFCSKTLDGPWERWDATPKFSEGVRVEAICSLPGRDALLAFCEYDSSYIRNKKKPEEHPYVMYFGASKRWEYCTWGGSKRFYSEHPPVFSQIGDKLMGLNSGEILTSNKGYEWSLQETKLHIDEHFALKDLSIFTSRNRSSIYLSQDTKTFKELTLEDGHWSLLIANEKGIVGVYYVNRHEKTVLRVGRYIINA